MRFCMRDLKSLTFISVLSFVSAMGCKRVSTVNYSGFILGSDDNIKRLDESTAEPDIAKALKQTVLIATTLKSGGQKFCSGMLVELEAEADTRRFAVLTNFHCFANKTQDGKVGGEFIEEACNSTKVYFGFSYDKANDVSEMDCVEGSLRGDHDGDLATFLLSRDPENGAHGVIFWDGDKTPVDEPAFLIHHPDVRSNYRRVGSVGKELPSAAITELGCFTKGDFPKQEWPLDPSLPFSLKHSCDLIDGSSGSPIFHRASGRVLGVNWGGIEIAYPQSNKKINSATRASYVKAFFADNVEALKSNARETIADKHKKSKGSGEISLEDLKEQSCGVLGEGVGRTHLFLLLLPLFLFGLTLLPSKNR